MFKNAYDYLLQIQTQKENTEKISLNHQTQINRKELADSLNQEQVRNKINLGDNPFDSFPNSTNLSSSDQDQLPSEDGEENQPLHQKCLILKKSSKKTHCNSKNSPQIFEQFKQSSNKENFRLETRQEQNSSMNSEINKNLLALLDLQKSLRMSNEMQNSNYSANNEEYLIQIKVKGSVSNDILQFLKLIGDVQISKITFSEVLQKKNFSPEIPIQNSFMQSSLKTRESHKTFTLTNTPAENKYMNIAQSDIVAVPIPEIKTLIKENSISQLNFVKRQSESQNKNKIPFKQDTKSGSTFHAKQPSISSSIQRSSCHTEKKNIMAVPLKKSNK